MNQKQDHMGDQKDRDTAEGFYSRWSRRKLQTQSAPLTEQESSLPQATDAAKTPAADTTCEDEAVADKDLQLGSAAEKVLLRDEDMPELDSLDENSDYSGFLSPGVSEQLRKLALRKLFLGQCFNRCDGLDDYDEEFTSFEKLGDIVTADIRHQLEEQAKQKLQAASANGELKPLPEVSKPGEQQLTGTDESLSESCTEDIPQRDFHTPKISQSDEKSPHNNEDLS